MKRVIFTSACLALLFTACKKEDVGATNDTPSALVAASSTGVYVSNWESVPHDSWQSSATTNGTMSMTFNRATPQVNENVRTNGKVLVFAKGYSFADTSINKPMSMPFDFYLPFERMAFPYTWLYDAGNGQINVVVGMRPGMERDFNKAQDDIKFRYVVLPYDYFVQTGLTTAALSRMSYADLMERLHASL
ncbi:MAG: hypothetical protein JWP27_2251 [Flaviaesturariibacter sp.]|nr:hypothetical protein [Flaviaesturariibacter sp.]